MKERKGKPRGLFCPKSAVTKAPRLFKAQGHEGATRLHNVAKPVYMGACLVYTEASRTLGRLRASDNVTDVTESDPTLDTRVDRKLQRAK